MKKYLIKIVICVVLLALFKDSVSAQAKSGEISIIQLKELKADRMGSLTIVTKDTTFNFIPNWETTDSSITFCDYGANYFKKIGEFRMNNLGDTNNSERYPKPDTLSIPFTSMEKIIYKEQLNSSYSESKGTSKGTPSRFGGEVNWRYGEITLAILNEVQIGIYRMVVKVNTTFLPEGGDTRISSSGLYTLGYMLAAGVAMGTIHKEDVGEKGQMIYALVLGSPLLLTNAEHHLFILNAPGYYKTDPFALSSFIAFRTDYFGPKWIVYSTDVGFQFELNLENEDGDSFGNSLAFKTGYEFTYDGKKGDFWTSRLFWGLKSPYSDLQYNDCELCF